MARIYKLTDRIKYKIGEIEIQISPLSLDDKASIHTLVAKGQSGDSKAIMQSSAQAIKCGVKSISGLEDSEGKPYELQFEENGKYLTDECVEDLLNLQETTQMIVLCSQLLAGIPKDLPNGVKLVEDKRPNAQGAQKRTSKSSGSLSLEK